MGLKIWDATNHLLGAITGEERVPMQSAEIEIPKFFKFKDLKMWIFNSKINPLEKNKILVVNNLGDNIEVKNSNGLINVDVNSAIEDMPTAITEINLDNFNGQSKIKINNTWTTWLTGRLIKQGGQESFVPVKLNNTNYNWSWLNLATVTTFLNNLVDNNYFTNRLANNQFFKSLFTTLIFNGSDPDIQDKIDAAVKRAFDKIVNNPTPDPTFSLNIFNSFPIGVILAWNPANLIPNKWAACDGSGGRPNLNGDRYIIGGNNNGTFGGDVNLTLDNIPNHTHAIGGSTTTNGKHTHKLRLNTGDREDDDNARYLTASGGSGNDIGVNDDWRNEYDFPDSGYSSTDPGFGSSLIKPDGEHSHTLPEYTGNIIGLKPQTSNRPESVTMFFIIKVS